MNRVRVSETCALEWRAREEVANDPGAETRPWRIRLRMGRGKRARSWWLSDEAACDLIVALADALYGAEVAAPFDPTAAWARAATDEELAMPCARCGVRFAMHAGRGVCDRFTMFNHNADAGVRVAHDSGCTRSGTPCCDGMRRAMQEVYADAFPDRARAPEQPVTICECHYAGDCPTHPARWVE